MTVDVLLCYNKHCGFLVRRILIRYYFKEWEIRNSWEKSFGFLLQCLFASYLYGFLIVLLRQFLYCKNDSIPQRMKIQGPEYRRWHDLFKLEEISSGVLHSLILFHGIDFRILISFANILADTLYMAIIFIEVAIIC